METLTYLFDPVYEPPKYGDHAKPGEAQAGPPIEFYEGNIKEELYGFTYRFNGNYEPTKEQYDRILKNLRNRGTVIDYVYEDCDKSGKPTRLHIHGIIKFDKKNPYFKSLMWFGCKSHFELIYNRQGWEAYIKKNKKTK